MHAWSSRNKLFSSLSVAHRVDTEDLSYSAGLDSYGRIEVSGVLTVASRFFTHHLLSSRRLDAA